MTKEEVVDCILRVKRELYPLSNLIENAPESRHQHGSLVYMNELRRVLHALMLHATHLADDIDSGS